MRFMRIEPWLLLAIAAIFGFGLFVQASASYQEWLNYGRNYVLRQVIWMGLGLVGLLLVLRAHYAAILSWAYVFYIFNIAVLGIMLFIGHVSMGAQRWINIFGFTFQPSEFSKIVLILAIARFAADHPRWQNNLRFFLTAFFMVLLPMTLIALQPDLGTALIFMPILFAMLYSGGLKLRYIVFFLILFIIAAPLGWHFLKDYQKNRLLVFLNPSFDPLGAGYTIIQSRIAIGSGRLFGKGWFSGTQNQLNFLPERHTDFIFSVVGEEWGFCGSFAIIILYLIFIWRIFSIAQEAKSSSCRMLAIGIGTMFSAHIIINIAMTIGLMPVVGLPLPFLSYGGSSLVSAMLAIGLLLNIQANRGVF